MFDLQSARLPVSVNVLFISVICCRETNVLFISCVVGKTRTKDKYRVVYTDHQRLELEKEFHYSRYITIRRKAELAQNLNLSERQVKIWFQNRRAKERKQNKKREENMGGKTGSELTPVGPPVTVPGMPGQPAGSGGNHPAQQRHDSPVIISPGGTPVQGHVSGPHPHPQSQVVGASGGVPRSQAPTTTVAQTAHHQHS